jgi:hypothetical protein
MAFGRLGALGGGFGRLGAGNAGLSAVGGAALLVGEQNGIGVDFTHPVDAQRVAVKTAGTVVYSSLDSFFSNSATGPKLVWDATGSLAWVPHNLFLNSTAPATQSVTTIVGQRYTVTVTGTGSLTGSAGAAGVATVGSPLTFVASTTTSTFTLAGSLTRIQMNAGDVATAYLATTGARRFGMPIDYDPLLGPALLCEISLANSCLWANDFTQAAWAKTNMSAALTATGPTGVANSASTLTATAANATALQSIVLGSASRLSSVFLKRRTGTGNVDVTQDNGATWATQTITSSWARYSIAAATFANPIVGVRLATSGDAVDVAIFQHEQGSVVHATSPIPAFGLLVTRAADGPNFLLSSIPALGSEYSLYVRFVHSNTAVQNATAPFTLGDGTANEQSRIGLGGGLLRLSVTVGGSSTGTMLGTATSPNVPMSAAGRVKVDDCAFSMGGAAIVADTTVPSLPAVTTVLFGNIGVGTAATNCMRIQKMAIITDRGWNNATLVTKSAA